MSRRQPIASAAEIARELPRDGSYPTPTRPGATAREISDARARDAAIVFAAACRAERRRRAELAAWHRARAAELEEVAA